MDSRCWQFHQIDCNACVSIDKWMGNYIIILTEHRLLKITRIELHESQPMPENVGFGVIMPEFKAGQ